jgi:hypothetical protein
MSTSARFCKMPTTCLNEKATTAVSATKIEASPVILGALLAPMSHIARRSSNMSGRVMISIIAPKFPALDRPACMNHADMATSNMRTNARMITHIDLILLTLG